MNIEIFKSNEFGEVRVAELNGEPMFCLSDICNALGISNARNVKNRIDEEDVHQIDTPTKGGNQLVTYVSEPGLYNVILRSDSEKAKPFRKWVTGEVLPSIRRHGGYMVIKDNESEEDLMARALVVAQATLKRKEQRIKELELKTEEDAPKVDFFNAVVDSKDAISMDKVAKTLNMGVGRNKLFEFLRDKKVLMPNNNPYQRYVDLEWFRCIESRYSLPNGDTKIYIKTVVLQKGLDGIRKLLKQK